ncbi:centromere protein T isoform X2 [Ascaphus truei]|uniref:centromere protein T isoform X2 n=1 Tax=Ascaphus truei TaxID=8439 RepID=UPI003F5A289D
MADPSEEDFTPRVLLRKILSSEPSRSAVRHQPKLRASELEQPSTRNLRSTPKNLNSDISILSPSMKLRSKMKQKVRHSIDRATSVGPTRKSVSRIDSAVKQKTRQGKFLNVEDLDEITPRTLLKRIIQNEPEVSTIVSQRSAEVISEEREEGRRSDATRSSAGNMEISLPEFQEDDARAPVFGTTRKKKRFSITQFQRGVEERLPQTQESSMSKLTEQSGNMSTSASLSVLTRSLQINLDTPDVPESIEKRGLVRRPQKRRLICLQDFEEGVEKNYQQLKGSQDCFIEDGSGPQFDTSPNETAQMNTELYAQSAPKEKSGRQQEEIREDPGPYTDGGEEDGDELVAMRSTIKYSSGFNAKDGGSSIENIEHVTKMATSIKKGQETQYSFALAGSSQEDRRGRSLPLTHGLVDSVPRQSGTSKPATSMDLGRYSQAKGSGNKRTSEKTSVHNREEEKGTDTPKQRVPRQSGTSMPATSMDLGRYSQAKGSGNKRTSEKTSVHNREEEKGTDTPKQRGLQYSARAVPETSTSRIEPPVAKSAFYSTTKRQSVQRLEDGQREEAGEQVTSGDESEIERLQYSARTISGTSTNRIAPPVAKSAFYSLTKRQSVQRLEDGQREEAKEQSVDADEAGEHVTSGEESGVEGLQYSARTISGTSTSHIESPVAKSAFYSLTKRQSAQRLEDGQREEAGEQVTSGDESEIERLQYSARTISGTSTSRIESPVAKSAFYSLTKRQSAQRLEDGQRGEQVTSGDESEIERLQYSTRTISGTSTSRIAPPVAKSAFYSLTKRQSAQRLEDGQREEAKEQSVDDDEAGEHVTSEEESGVEGLQYSARAVPETSTSRIEPPVAKSAFYSTIKSARRLEYRPREEAKKQSIEEDNDDDQFTDEEKSESEELSQMQSQKVPIKPQVLSPLANTPLYIKNARLKFLNKRPIAKRATKKKTDPGAGKKNEPAYPKSLVKQIFSHYAQMPVSKDAFPVVEKCLDLYMKRMCDDLEAYAHHAKRKTLIKADFELLFRRQGHVTDKRPLNVLIEQYLPLEYRKLLIPMATSGNKVFPKM